MVRTLASNLPAACAPLFFFLFSLHFDIYTTKQNLKISIAFQIRIVMLIATAIVITDGHHIVVLPEPRVCRDTRYRLLNRVLGSPDWNPCFKIPNCSLKLL